jgi:hypothetical protein
MIYQINIWTCEGCGATVTMGEETSPYSDPLVRLDHEPDWEYVGDFPNEKLICGVCQNEYNH